MEVDIEVHVHGQVTIPHTPNTPLRRKDRLILSVARQIAGLPPLPTTPQPGIVKAKSIDIFNRISGRSTPSLPSTERETLPEFVDEPLDLIDMSTPRPSPLRTPSTTSETSTQSQPFHIHHAASLPLSTGKSSPPLRSNTMPLTSSSRPTSSSSSTSSTGTWKNAHNFPLLDLATCHANFSARLAPFIARSVQGRLVTIKIYSPPSSETPHLHQRRVLAQRQFLTNEYGHFTGRMIISPPANRMPPESWTITAAISAPDRTVSSEVRFIPEHGISLISDIDDTVKHTAVMGGPRELFRNTFVRDLGALSVDGVREWYTRLTGMGVAIHYVSNSPYQCWPIVSSFMEINGLPRGGSVHLKQYSGMISGIWENAADKKRPGLETLIRVPPSLKRANGVGLSAKKVYFGG